MAPNASPAHPQHAVAESRQAPAPLLPPLALSRPRNAAKPTAKAFPAVAPAPIKIWGEGRGGRSCHQHPTAAAVTAWQQEALHPVQVHAATRGLHP